MRSNGREQVQRVRDGRRTVAFRPCGLSIRPLQLAVFSESATFVQRITKSLCMIMKPAFTTLACNAASVSLIASVFLAIVQPFGIDHIHTNKWWFLAGEMPIIFAGSMVSLIVVNYLLRLPTEGHLPLRTLNRNQLVLSLVNIPILSAFLTTFNGVLLQENIRFGWTYQGHFSFYHFSYFCYYVSSLSIFLFLFKTFINKNQVLRHELDDMRAINALLEERQERMDEHPEEAVSDGEEEPCCRLVGNANNAVLEVKPSALIYVESMANYADICYMDNDEARHKMLRITLKQIKESIGNEPFLVQCHRAFIVNLNFVVSLSNRNSAYQLQIFGTDKPIPVSRNNTAEVKEKLSAL